MYNKGLVDLVNSVEEVLASNLVVFPLSRNSIRIIMRSLVLIVFVFLFPLLLSAQKTTEEKLRYFLTLADSIREKSHTPGVGLAIVHQNKVIYTGGLGLRNRAKKIAVDEKTLFAIGSNTKAFTGVIAAKLVEEGKLKWKDPIIKHLPEFKLAEDYVSRNVTIEDALTHMTGLGRHDTLWNGKDISREEILEQLQYLSFHGSLRSEWQYNNLMYLVVGMALENIAGKSWGQLIQEEIFDPLGMNNSYTDYQGFMNCSQKSIGYRRDGFSPIAHKNTDNIGPAGSISSTPQDVAKWLELFVNKGKYQGKSFLRPETYEYLTGPKTMGYTDPCTIQYYAIGWGGWNREGKKDLGHGGAIDGQEAFVGIMPEDGFGVFIMTNHNTDLKYLLGRYATNIFVKDEYTRDFSEEAKLSKNY